MKQVYKDPFPYTFLRAEFNRLDKPRQVLAVYICMHIYQTKALFVCTYIGQKHYFVFVLQFFVISFFLFLLITMKGVHNAKRSAVPFKQFVPLVLTYIENICD